MTTTEIGGWYLAADVALLAGVSARTVGQWERYEYIRASRRSEPPEVFNYLDVGEALCVRALFEAKVPPAEIRAAVQNAREQYGDWPLQAAPLGVYRGPARSRVGLEVADGIFDIGQLRSRGGQRFLELGQSLQYLAQLLRRGGWVIQNHPNITHIEVDPDRLSGKPAIVGRRIPAALVASMAAEKGGRRTLREDFNLTREEIEDAVEWWEAASSLREAA